MRILARQAPGQFVGVGLAVQATAQTQGSVLHVQLDSNFLNSNVTAAGDWRLTTGYPGEAKALLLRARYLGAMHRFAEAEAEYARAEKLGASDTRTKRASLHIAEGRELDDALAVARERVAKLPTLEHYSLLAAPKPRSGFTTLPTSTIGPRSRPITTCRRCRSRTWNFSAA